jgi:hydantoinase/carbamoylase family amidase
MALRHDALAAAAECILAAERAARDEPGSVATVGRLTVAPNQSNVVPGSVELFLEVRSLDADQIERIWQRVMAQTRAAAAHRGVSLGIGTQTEAAATRPPAWLLELVEDACRAVDPATQRLVSGAGHDMMHLAQVTAAAMIFVPCRDGRSHCPDEYATPEDCGRGARALLEAVLRLDARGVA